MTMDHIKAGVTIPTAKGSSMQDVERVDRPRYEVDPASERRPRRYLTLAGIGALALGFTLRWWPRSALWLDEAQSVAIARLPLGQIPRALRQDGAPPLYYVLLHQWMSFFGVGDGAVRSLSALCSIGAVCVLAVVAHRLAGRSAAWCAALLMMTSPFAIRYATETRMYALLTLEVALLVLAAHECLRRDGQFAAHLGVAGCSAALLYTHYWALYVLGASVVVLLALGLVPRWQLSQKDRRQCLVVAGSIGAGFVAWLPWLPTFLFQRRHTGTPWSQASIWRLLPDSARAGITPGWLFGGLVAAAAVLMVRRSIKGGAQVDTGATRMILAVLAIAAIVALVGATLSRSALVVRYHSVLFPLFKLLVAIRVPSTSARVRTAILVAACTVGLVMSVREAGHERTPAARFATRLERDAQPRDLIVYCPDQLGPALSRLLEGGQLAAGQVPFPSGNAGRVDWVDYGQRYAVADSAAFARTIVARAGGATIWLVWSDKYPPTQTACTKLFSALSSLRPTAHLAIPENFADGDHGALWRFSA